MEISFIISATTDVGIKKQVNQDSLVVRKLSSSGGNMVFAVLCDGMGGLSYGEIASATVVEAFSGWMYHTLPLLADRLIPDHIIKEQWLAIVEDKNRQICQFGHQHQCELGTTVSVLLLTRQRYYALNVGDSRIYEIGSDIRQITRDHSLVAKEVEHGNLTVQQAEHAPFRNVLTQCVGGNSETVEADMFFGTTQPDAVYMLCSDGLRHEVDPKELQDCFSPRVMGTEAEMKAREEYLIALNKQRGETDNISVITVRTKYE